MAKHIRYRWSEKLQLHLLAHCWKNREDHFLQRFRSIAPYNPRIGVLWCRFQACFRDESVDQFAGSRMDWQLGLGVGGRKVESNS